MGDTPEEIASDVDAIARIEAVPTLLQVLCDITGMGFAAVARVTDKTWTACAIQDVLGFGLEPGGQLDVNTTLCIEVRETRTPIVIDHASTDPRYCNHHTPKHYSIESYVSVPVIMADGRYFGNLCALDPQPRRVSDANIVSMFERFAHLIAMQLESELARESEHAALLDARAASELREQFIAVLGHDLRNPLYAIANISEILVRRSTDPVLTELGARIKNNVRRMSALIDDVLDFARGRLGGGIGVQLESVEDVGSALGAVVKELQDSQPDRNIISNLEVSRPVRCDLGRLQQVASNLVANALTHGSSTGEVHVNVTADGDELVLDVRNDGRPIPREKMANIFEPFWRHSASESRQGLGLGLYICSEIVKAHGGTLSAQSSAEHGTRFTARFPMEIAAAATAAPMEGAACSPSRMNN
jgi:signal transduction histidine kinase